MNERGAFIIHSMVVLLPAPLAPSKPNTVPVLTDQSRRFRTVFP